MSSIKYKPEPEVLEQFEEWIDGRPHLAEMIRQYSPFHCYRSKENGGHYAIRSYNDSGKHVTVTHGRDSFLPGVSVFGVSPESLTICDCGEFLFPGHEDDEEVDA